MGNLGLIGLMENMIHRILVISFLVVITSYFIIFLDESTLLKLGVEDGPIENMGAISFLVGASLYLFAYLKTATLGDFFSIRKRRIYLLIAILLFLSFGEEISWGQRILGWESSEVFKNLNKQGETNIHNLRAVEDLILPDGTKFNLNYLYKWCWGVYCIFLPCLAASHQKLRKFFDRVGLPVPPISIGALYLTNLIIAQTIFATQDLPRLVNYTFDELQESNYAFILAILGGIELKRIYSRRCFPSAKSGAFEVKS